MGDKYVCISICIIPLKLSNLFGEIKHVHVTGGHGGVQLELLLQPSLFLQTLGHFLWRKSDREQHTD
jgi:hypothetical protein